MAVVYAARDTVRDTPVAIKVLRDELTKILGPQRFLREIEIASRLSHPAIVPVIDSGQAAGSLYYVMPFIEGETLRARLKRETQLPLDDALRITREVAKALTYVHANQVVHRDIKPENILLSGNQVVLADFGIARVLGNVDQETLSTTGLAIGTPTYMSPEQAAASQNIDSRSDIYSLGCVLSRCWRESRRSPGRRRRRSRRGISPSHRGQFGLYDQPHLRPCRSRSRRH